MLCLQWKIFQEQPWEAEFLNSSLYAAHVSKIGCHVTRTWALPLLHRIIHLYIYIYVNVWYMRMMYMYTYMIVFLPLTRFHTPEHCQRVLHVQQYASRTLALSLSKEGGVRETKRWAKSGRLLPHDIYNVYLFTRPSAAPDIVWISTSTCIVGDEINIYNLSCDISGSTFRILFNIAQLYMFFIDFSLFDTKRYIK